MVGGSWGNEEFLPLGPIRIGAEFELLSVFDDDKFVLSVNGQRHGEFRHRIGKHLVTDYELKGLDIKSVKLPKVPEVKAKVDINLPKVDIDVKPKAEVSDKCSP
jgi:hypothetical protein